MDTGKATGFVTIIWQVEQHTLQNMPAIVSDFETTKGRTYGFTILTEDRIIQIACNAKDYTKYKPDFDHVLDTLKVSSE